MQSWIFTLSLFYSPFTNEVCARSSSRLSSTREKWTNWIEFSEGPKKWWSDESTPPMKWGWELALVSLEKWGCNEDEARLFQWCPVTGREAKVTNRNTGGSTRTFRNTFFTVWVTVFSQRLSREVLQCPSLKTIRSHLHMLLGILVFTYIEMEYVFTYIEMEYVKVLTSFNISMAFRASDYSGSLSYQVLSQL